MPEFILDTSGEVRGVSPAPVDAAYGGLTWSHLDPFTQGYIEALFFTEEESLCEQSGGTHEMPDVAFDLATMESRFVGGSSPGFSDLAPQALASIVADCEAFQRDNAATLSEAYQRDYDAEQAGRDYWYTRNGHGVGYWDRPALKAESIGERLSEAARASGEVYAHLGDDGKVYV